VVLERAKIVLFGKSLKDGLDVGERGRGGDGERERRREGESEKEETGETAKRRNGGTS
jgi:hypothetical protein